MPPTKKTSDDSAFSWNDCRLAARDQQVALESSHEPRTASRSTGGWIQKEIVQAVTDLAPLTYRTSSEVGGVLPLQRSHTAVISGSNPSSGG